MSHVEVERLTTYAEEDVTRLAQLMPVLSERFRTQPINTNLLDKIIASDSHDQLIARLEGRIVGAATLSLIIGLGAGEEGYLQDFVVDPEIQGQGIGDRVWSEMMRWCDERGIDLAFTSNPSREAAHRFYLAHGATIRETTVFHVNVGEQSS